MKLGAHRRQERQMIAHSDVERKFKSLLVQLSMSIASALCYMRTGYNIFWLLLLYFLANACFLLFYVLVKISYVTRKNKIQNNITDKKITQKTTEHTFYAPQEHKKIEDIHKNKAEVNMACT